MKIIISSIFDYQHILISLGFTAIALIIAAFNLTLILSWEHLQEGLYSLPFDVTSYSYM